MNPQIYFNEVNERQGVFHRRAFLMGGVAGVGLTALSARLAYLQLIDANKYRTLSLNNEFQSRLQPPPRGVILDRNGIVLASNRPDFRLYVSRADDTTDIDALLERLQKLVPLDDAHRQRLFQDVLNAPRRAQVTVMEDLTWEEFSRINVRAPELPGVTADMGDIRVYSYPAAFAHVVGYVGKVSKDDVTKDGPNSDPILLNPGFRIGKAGLEKTYDIPMRGKTGAKKVEVDVKGRVVREAPGGDIPSTPGKELHLTLDVDIQNRALEVFGPESGAAVMMDCRTGNVLCFFSSPSFDTNRFVKGMTFPEYAALSGYERKPLLNKAIAANYPPGSTFGDEVVALTALQKGISPSTTFVCGGSWSYGGRVWHCDKAHGALDLKGGIAHSCDIYFYQMALKIGGPDPIAATARDFGLGQSYDIGFDPREQRSGLIPTTEWVAKARPRDPVWHPGETCSIGIGQGAVLVNPLQLCVMCSRLANGQKAIMPRLVHQIGEEPAAHQRHRQHPGVRSGPRRLHPRGDGPGGERRHGRQRLGQARPRPDRDGRQDRHRPVAWLHRRRWGRLPRRHRLLEPARPLLVHRLRPGGRSALRHELFGRARRIWLTPARRGLREIMRVALLKDPRSAQAHRTAGAAGHGAAAPAERAAGRRRRAGVQRRDQPRSAHMTTTSGAAFTAPGERRLFLRLVDVDWTFCAAITLIAIAGAAMLYSVAGGKWEPWAAKHLISYGFWFIAMIALAMVDLQIWFAIAYPVYAISLLLLAVVAVHGHETLGARRWLSIGPIKDFQPSEIVKLALVLALARFYHGLSAKSARLSFWLLVPAALIALPAALVMKEPDLGTALLISATGFTMMVLAGLDLRIVGVLAAGAAGVVPFLHLVLKPYQWSRLSSFVNPDALKSGAGYHLHQSEIVRSAPADFWARASALAPRASFELPARETDRLHVRLAGRRVRLRGLHRDPDPLRGGDLHGPAHRRRDP